MKNLKAKLRRDGGFTLVEMLIVVAIIAILVAVSIPVIGSALESARDATDRANERAAKAETFMYYMGVTEETLTIGGKGYEAGSAITEADNVYYDAVNGGLVVGTAPKGYGQCRGGTGDKYNTGNSHVDQVIKVTITDKGIFTATWATGTTS